MEQRNFLRENTNYFVAMSVGMILFSSHAGGGFASGNQANTYFVSLGWPGMLSALLAMFILTRAMREAMYMYNSQNLSSYKELFQTLYSPFDKLSVLFDVFFYIMVIMAIAATISGAASALQEYFPLHYGVYVGIVGGIVLLFTVFGSDMVRKVSTILGIMILVSAMSIYIIGVFKGPNLSEVLAFDKMTNGYKMVPKAILHGFTYAGFQCVTLPTMIVCGKVLKNRKEVGAAMDFSFLFNALGLVLSVAMLTSWHGIYTNLENGTTLPTLMVTKEIGLEILSFFYGFSLILCSISTGVTITFGFVSRFENMKTLSSVKSVVARRAILVIFIIALSMIISMLGLTNIIKYGYGYCGYLAIGAIILPLLTVGAYKNRAYRREKLQPIKDSI
ncbi:MAG: hypothetical protein Q4Q07_09910 [Tissierellia bacterium]|nr:hypothetical protein [Tissierellia bacterium]